jgi:hypothetical protein
MDERQIERVAARLGSGAAETVDVHRLSASVLARLRDAGGARRPRPVARWLAVAAGLVIVAGATYYTFGVGDARPPTLSGVAPPQLAGLNSAELGEILDALTVEPVSLFGQVSLDDLNAEQLAELLQLMEG